MNNKRIDVLAVMDADIARRRDWAPSAGHDLCGPITPDLSNPILAAAQKRLDDAIEARAAVAELIEADKEYDEARAAWERAELSIPADGTSQGHPALIRLHVAINRRRAALARVQGGAK